jgi:hypothetical protein
MPSSAVGALAVIEALAAAVAQLNPDAALVAREMSELVLSYLATTNQTPVHHKTKEEL